jgi:hypothetical protein
MNPLEQLHVKNRNFNNIRDFNIKFLNNLKVYAVHRDRDVPSTIEFLSNDEFLVVKGFGYEAKTSPRFVMTENSVFAVEYVFYVQIDDNKIEVFRFYFTNECRIAKSLEPNDNICDFNDEYASSQICIGVLNGIVNSSLFAPSNAIKE